ncbi:cytochrome P450 714C2-like [Aristolochia californica]|uniref:cytochrome P450 714C2-like n=1 Tax=Aristolochia californica TaxID=171875 RepID=UPI0035E0F93D
MEIAFSFVLSLAFLAFVTTLLYLYTQLWWKPERMREKLRRQGIRGPPPSLLLGNIQEMKQMAATTPTDEKEGSGGKVDHQYISRLFPYFQRWKELYGSIFTYTLGSMPVMYVSQPEVVKEMNLYKSLDLGRPSYHQKDTRAMFGQGIISSNGLAWAHQRKLISSELFMEKVKGMVNLMVESTIPLLKSWESKIEMEEKGITDMRIDEDMRNLSADVIAKACFGSSYLKGQFIFQKIRKLQTTMSTHRGVPGLRYLPTKTNRNTWRLEKEINSLILKVVKERREEVVTRSERDLLQSILEEAKSNNMVAHMADRFVVDNCKNIYFAGHETTAIAATWTLLLLALNPEWQARARQEIVDVCGAQHPDASMIKRMKTLTMVIQESMRLYPPAPFVAREAFQDMVFGGICVPKGLTIWISIAELHRDPEIWGLDANEFRPERFKDGVSNACEHPYVYMPFGLGIRTCLGLNFAMVELKVVLSLLLSKFAFSLSPRYVHAPTFKMFLEPGNGVNLLVKRL